MMRHSKIEALLAVYREVDPATRAQVDAHVRTCTTCQARLAAYQQMDAAFNALPQPSPDFDLRPRTLAALAQQATRQPVSARPRARLQLRGVALAAAGVLLALALAALATNQRWTQLPSPQSAKPATASVDATATSAAYSPLPTLTATMTLAEVQAVYYQQDIPAFWQEFFADHTTAAEAELKLLAQELTADDLEGAGMSDLKVTTIAGSVQTGLPVLLFTWRDGINDLRSFVMLAWRDPQTLAWKQQRFLDYGTLLVNARVQADGGQRYLAMISNGCGMGSTGSCQGLQLYRFTLNSWAPVDSPAGWNSSLAQAQFVGEGLNTVAVRNSDFEATDDKSRIFRPNRDGLHRWFNEIWQRQGEHYVRVSHEVEASPYNTLLEFLYALRTQGDTSAWVTVPDIEAQAQQLGLTEAGGQAGCREDMEPACEQTGPLEISHDEGRVCVEFTRQAERVLIARLWKLSNDAEDCFGPAAPLATDWATFTVPQLGLTFKAPAGSVVDINAALISNPATQHPVFTLTLPAAAYTYGNMIGVNVLAYELPDGGLTHEWLDRLYALGNRNAMEPVISHNSYQIADTGPIPLEVISEVRPSGEMKSVYVPYGRLVFKVSSAADLPDRFLPALAASFAWAGDAPATLDALYGSDVTPPNLDADYQALLDVAAVTPPLTLPERDATAAAQLTPGPQVTYAPAMQTQEAAYVQGVEAGTLSAVGVVPNSLNPLGMVLATPVPAAQTGNALYRGQNYGAHFELIYRPDLWQLLTNRQGNQAVLRHENIARCNLDLTAMGEGAGGAKTQDWPMLGDQQWTRINWHRLDQITYSAMLDNASYVFDVHYSGSWLECQNAAEEVLRTFTVTTP